MSEFITAEDVEALRVEMEEAGVTPRDLLHRAPLWCGRKFYVIKVKDDDDG